MHYRVVGVVLLLMLSTGGIGTSAKESVQQRSGDLQTLWTSEPKPSETLQSNHHTPAAVHFRNETYVAVPLNSRQGTFCSLTMLNGQGNIRWRDTIPEDQCTVHAVSDPTIADFDSDGWPEVLAATSEQVLVAYNLTTGDEELRYNLTSYGYSKPIIANLTAAKGPETAVVDLLGGVFVLRPNGDTVWKRKLGDARVRQPGINDYDADGTPEFAIGQLTGPVTLLEHDGGTAWRTNISDSVSTRWMTSGQLDTDSPVEIGIATYTGHIAALDGREGTIQWTQDLGGANLSPFAPTSHATNDWSSLHGTKGAAVKALGDGDGDGQAEVYPVARNGKLYSLTGTNGSVEWSQSLTNESVTVSPPPSLGDVTGDGEPELVAVTFTGAVKVLDPKAGNVLATYSRKTPIRTFPRITDFDGDGINEILVIYGDGRVVALSYSSSR